MQHDQAPSTPTSPAPAPPPPPPPPLHDEASEEALFQMLSSITPMPFVEREEIFHTLQLPLSSQLMATSPSQAEPSCETPSQALHLDSDNATIKHTLEHICMTEIQQWYQDGCLFQGYVQGKQQQQGDKERPSSFGTAPLSSIMSDYDLTFSHPTAQYMYLRLLRVHCYWHMHCAHGPLLPPHHVFHFEVTAPCNRCTALVECEWLNAQNHQPYTRQGLTTQNGAAAADEPYRVLLLATDWPPLCNGAIYVCRCAFYRVHPDWSNVVFFPPNTTTTTSSSQHDPQMSLDLASKRYATVQFGSPYHRVLFTRAYVYRAIDSPYAVNTAALHHLPLLLDIPSTRAQRNRPVEFLDLCNTLGLVATADSLWTLFSSMHGNDESAVARLAKIVCLIIDEAPFVAWTRGFITTASMLRRYLDGSVSAHQAYTTMAQRVKLDVTAFLTEAGLIGRGEAKEEEEVAANAEVATLIEQQVHEALSSQTFWQGPVLACYRPLQELSQQQAQMPFTDVRFEITFSMPRSATATTTTTTTKEQHHQHMCQLLYKHFVPYALIWHYTRESLRMSARRCTDVVMPAQRHMVSYTLDMYVSGVEVMAAAAATLLFNIASITLSRPLLSSSSTAMPVIALPHLTDSAVLLVDTTPRTVSAHLAQASEQLHALRSRSVGELFPEQIIDAFPHITTTTTTTTTTTWASTQPSAPSTAAAGKVESVLANQLVHGYYTAINQQTISSTQRPAWILWNVHRYDDRYLLCALRIIALAMAAIAQRIKADTSTATQQGHNALPQLVLVGALAWPNNRALLQYQMRAMSTFGNGATSATAQWLLTVRPPCECVLDTRLTDLVTPSPQREHFLTARHLCIFPEQRMIALLVPTWQSLHGDGPTCEPLPPLILLYCCHTEDTDMDLSSWSERPMRAWPSTIAEASQAALIAMAALRNSGVLDVPNLDALCRCRHILLSDTPDNRPLSTLTRTHYSPTVLHVDASLFHTKIRLNDVSSGGATATGANAASSSSSPSHSNVDDRMHMQKLYSLVDATETALIVHCTNYYDGLCYAPLPSDFTDVLRQGCMDFQYYCRRRCASMVNLKLDDNDNDDARIQDVINFMLMPLFGVADFEQEKKAFEHAQHAFHQGQ